MPKSLSAAPRHGPSGPLTVMSWRAPRTSIFTGE